MADTGIFCSGGTVIRKAGAGAAATGISEVYTNDFISQAESLINVMCRENYSDKYATLNSDVKGVLTEVASDLAAIYSIQYNMAGYTSRVEAEDMINILRDAALRGISILRDKKQQDFINGA